MKKLVFFAILAASLATYAWSWEWSWGMPSSVYSQLDFSARRGVDRAIKQYRTAEDQARGQRIPSKRIAIFRAAAAEWKKVQMQGEMEAFPESLVAYCLFMNGYALREAGDRNEAIKLFNEVLDLYDEEKWVAVPAQYFLARCKAEMGDTKAAGIIDNELRNNEEPEYRNHPLMANLFSWKASAYWDEGKESKAREIWQMISDSTAWRDNARRVWDSARGSLQFCMIVGEANSTKDLTAAVTVYCGKDDAGAQANAMRGHFHNIPGWINNGFGGYGDYIRNRSKSKDRAARMKKFEEMHLQWAKEIESIVGKGKYQDDYVSTWRNIRVELAFRKKDYKAALDTAYEIKDIMAQCWYRRGLQERMGDWAGVIATLEEIEKRKPDNATLTKIKWDKAWIWWQRLGQLDKALQAYRELNQPPRTLWYCCDIYRAKKDNKMAYSLLKTLQGLPGEAAAAVWREGQWREQDGQKELAIGFYRRLLSQPEWKTTQYSSSAHQALERLGVKTGGAMTGDVH